MTARRLVGSGYSKEAAMASELIKEFCAENVERVPEAIAAGAGRIELCDNLAVGGTIWFI